MTYTEFISRVNEKVRDVEAWPVGASASSEQLHLSFIAALTVIRQLAARRLSFEVSAALDKEADVGNLEMYYLPEDGMFFRSDYGISYFLLDDTPHFIFQAQSYDVLKSLSSMRMHRCQAMFSIDPSSRTLFVSGADKVQVYYAKMPAEPTAGGDSFPLSTMTDIEQAASIVAAHVSGETIRDAQATAFESLLAEIYGDPIESQGQEGEP